MHSYNPPVNIFPTRVSLKANTADIREVKNSAKQTHGQKTAVCCNLAYAMELKHQIGNNTTALDEMELIQINTHSVSQINSS